MSKKIILNSFLILFLFMSGCSIKMINRQTLYDPNFLKKINGIQEIHNSGDSSGALAKLNQMEDEGLAPHEIGMKYNLRGLIHQSNKDYDFAIKDFEFAARNTSTDKALNAEVHLNLAKTYFTLNKYEPSFANLKRADISYLEERLHSQYYQLSYFLNLQKGNTIEVVESLINFLGDLNSFDAVESHQYKDVLTEKFSEISNSERNYLFKKYESKKYIVLGYLGKQEVLRRYYSGDKDGARDMLEWLERKVSFHAEVLSFITDFKNRISIFSKINLMNIGVVLPFEDKKNVFSKKILAGIDAYYAEDPKETKLTIYTEDNHNDPQVAQKVIRELILKRHVSLIIGGLFSSTEAAEYLEARKYGVLFLSLSPVYLPREEKNHLLIELQGSIQSQIKAVFNEEFLNHFGRRIAMFYPKNETGDVYSTEVWEKSKERGVELNALASFDKDLKDYREPVGKLLGLHFKEERREEFALWEEIYSKMKKGQIRRIQTLTPVIDFDWVYLPAYPNESLQIIPSFSYYDAKNIKFIGGPSWLSPSLIKEQKNLGRLYFMGDDPKDFSDKVKTYYERRYKGKQPGLLEALGMESFNIAKMLLSDEKLATREDLENKLLKQKSMQGLTGSWNLEEGIWIKKMSLIRIINNDIRKIQFSTEVKEEEGV
jgi:outer membrane PBP1 activator LpoA protein